MKLLYGLLVSIILLVGLFIVVPHGAHAAYDPTASACKTNPSSSVCKASRNDPITGNGSVLFKITNIIAWFGGVLAVIFIVYAGFLYVTSGGDSGKVKTAKDIILYSAVGLVVIVMARSIVIFALNRLL